MILPMLLLATLAQPADTQRVLYVGDIHYEWIDVLLRVDTVQVLGASYRPKEKTLRLLTGTVSKGHVTIHEWATPWEETATIDARIVSPGLRGRWRKRGAAHGALFDFWKEERDSPLVNRGDLSFPAFDRLHNEIRAGRWDSDEAKFDARLACALNEEGCRWLAALPALARGEVPAPAGRAPWEGLLLEKERGLIPAAAAHHDLCDRFVRMACLFLHDLLPRLSADDRKREAAMLCEHHGVACVEVWGATEVSLSEAAARGGAAAVEKLLLMHPDVNAGYPVARPLYGAVMARSLPVVKLLIEHGADPNGESFGDPLQMAVVNNFDEIASYLLDHGAKPRDGTLWEAEYRGKHDFIRKALAKGADPNDDVPAGSTLTLAVDRRDVPMVRELLAHCADPNLETKFSQGSPIDHARRLGAKKILAMLLAPRKGC